MEPPPSSFLHQPQNLAVGTVREHVQRAVGSFVDAANARVEIRRQPLLRDDAAAVEHEARQIPAQERRDEQVAVPRRVAMRIPAIRSKAEPRRTYRR